MLRWKQFFARRLVDLGNCSPQAPQQSILYLKISRAVEGDLSYQMGEFRNYSSVVEGEVVEIVDSFLDWAEGNVKITMGAV